MTKRITFISRTGAGAFRSIGVSGTPAFQSSEQIFDVLERRLSKRHRQVFSEPVTDGRSNGIDWWTDAEGSVVAYADMAPEEQEALRAEVGELFSDIEQTAKSLISADKGDSAAIGALLRAAMQSPAPEGLYRVGNSPIVTIWGHEPQSNRIVPIYADPIKSPPPVAPPESPPRVSETIIADAEEPRKKWFLMFPAWLRWLLMALLLLLLLLFLLRSCSPTDLGLGDLSMPGDSSTQTPDGATLDTIPPDPLAPENPSPNTPMLENSNQSDLGTGSNDTGDTVIVIDPDAPVAASGENTPPIVTDIVVVDPGNSSPGLPTEKDAELAIVLDNERLREQELRARVARLEEEIAAKQKECSNSVCAPQQTLPSPSTEVIPNQKPETQTAPQDPFPEPEAKPMPPAKELELEAPAAEVPAAEPLPPPQQAETTENQACPPPRQPFEAPEVVVVLDSSGSMGIDSSVPASRVEALVKRANAGDLSAARELASLDGAIGNRRIDQAQEALNDMISHLPDDVDVGFIDFGACDSIVNHEFYSANQRDKLMSVIRGTQPKDGTPLARALERAGNIIKGRNPEEKGVIVLVSDGYGTCGGNACAAARAIAKEKPGVTINVVTLGNYAEAQCIATAGRGQVYNAERGSIRNAIEKASEEPPLPEHCR